MATMNVAEHKRMQERGKEQFGTILLAVMNDGKRARRAGWIDRDRWIAYEAGCTADPNCFQHPGNRAYAEEQSARSVWITPCFTMKKPDGAIMLGWTPTQNDMTASDWYLLEDGE